MLEIEVRRPGQGVLASGHTEADALHVTAWVYGKPVHVLAKATPDTRRAPVGGSGQARAEGSASEVFAALTEVAASVRARVRAEVLREVADALRTEADHWSPGSQARVGLRMALDIVKDMR